MPYGDWNTNMGWGGGALMLLFALLFFGGLLLIVTAALRQHHHYGHDHHTAVHQSIAPRSGALTILDERFARGDIDEEEYKHRCALLSTDQ
ncbi:MAG TPA: SHOCT domain-containing protein [Acidimicrobiales bacterium]